MGAWDGNYSRTTYDKAKQYLRYLQFQGKPICDCDIIEGQQALYQLVASFISGGFGDKFFFDDSFKVEEALSPDNNFKVLQGDGYVGGNWAYLHEDSDFKGSGATTSQKNLHSISTALTALTLTDRAQNWVPNELVGRTLVPDITQPGVTFTITGNTATAITIGSGDMTVNAEVGDYYCVNMSTPSGANRSDTVYLNLYQDEISGAEDPAILQPLGGGLETSRRMKNRTMLHVRQGSDDWPSSYTDLDGNAHLVVKIATIQRTDGISAIGFADITDERFIFVQGSPGAQVKTSASDPGSGYLEDKIIQGDGIGVTTVDNQIVITNLMTGSTVKAYDDDETPGTLAGPGHPKLEAGSGITFTPVEPSPGDKRIRITATGGGGGGGGGNALYEEITGVVAQATYATSNHFTPGSNGLMIAINNAIIEHSAFTEDPDGYHFTLLAPYIPLEGGEKIQVWVARGDGTTLVDTDDETFGFLADKLLPGSGITITPEGTTDKALRFAVAGAGLSIGNQWHAWASVNHTFPNPYVADLLAVTYTSGAKFILIDTYHHGVWNAGWQSAWGRTLVDLTTHNCDNFVCHSNYYSQNTYGTAYGPFGVGTLVLRSRAAGGRDGLDIRVKTVTWPSRYFMFEMYWAYAWVAEYVAGAISVTELG